MATHNKEATAATELARKAMTLRVGPASVAQCSSSCSRFPPPCPEPLPLREIDHEAMFLIDCLRQIPSKNTQVFEQVTECVVLFG
jgi:hypothetical protein